MKGFLRVLRTLFGLILLAAFVFCFYRFYIVAPKSFDVYDTAEEQTIPDTAVTPAPTTAPAPVEATPEAVMTPVAAEATPEIAPEVTPEPVEESNGLPKVDIDSWELILVNANNPIGDYAPESLSTLEQQRFDSRIIDAMTSFITDARSEGLSVYLSSAYRPYEEQQYLFNRKIGQGYSEEVAATIVSRPGTSEHQTGLVCDITDRYYELKDKSLENTALYKWMSAHCQEYGFIVRYPENKQDITGIIYEPWHFRYVGVEAATYIMENDLCLEEFVALYR